MSQADNPPTPKELSITSSPPQTPLGTPAAATPPLQDTPTSLVEHYSTVCDAVDLSTRIYDEPPDSTMPCSRSRHSQLHSSSSSCSSTSPTTSAHRNSTHPRHSCSSCADQHYQPVDTSRGGGITGRIIGHPPRGGATRSPSRRHQYDCVYIPAACEHAMRRRVDAGGYVKCRRGPPSSLGPTSTHQHHYEDGDAVEEAEEGASLLQNAYEHLEYGGDSRPVLPRRRESLPVTTGDPPPGHAPLLSPTPSIDELPPQLPPRHRQSEQRESDLYEKIDLTHGCPMLRPLSSSTSVPSSSPPTMNAPHIATSTTSITSVSLDNPIPIATTSSSPSSSNTSTHDLSPSSSTALTISSPPTLPHVSPPTTPNDTQSTMAALAN